LPATNPEPLGAQTLLPNDQELNGYQSNGFQSNGQTLNGIEMNGLGAAAEVRLVGGGASERRDPGKCVARADAHLLPIGRVVSQVPGLCSSARRA
jgi:hypothetical protein